MSRYQGVIHRTFDTHQRAVRHLNLHIPVPVQNREHGRSLVARAAQLYRCLGLVEIHLTAVGIGQHAWAACGFSFADEREAALVRSDGRDLLRELGQDPDTIRDDDDAWELAGFGGSVPLVDLAEIRPRNSDVLGAAGEITFGKAIMLTSRPWRGYLNLHGVNAAILHDYAGLSLDETDLDAVLSKMP